MSDPTLYGTLSYEELMAQYAAEDRASMRAFKKAAQQKWKAKPLYERVSYQRWRYWTIYIADPWESLRARLADWVYPYGGRYD